MKLALSVLSVATIAALAGCDRDGATHTTTVVKEPAVVQKDRETVVEKQVPAPAAAPAPSTNVTVEAPKPDAKPEATTEKSTTTSRVDTPAGSATKTETTRTTTK